jgi:GH25 family lysozyme M1 (1,4-beta-N-acetylmuramidase)
VSVYEGTVNWPRAAGSLGFAIARVSDGLNTHDATFLPNWSGMKANGLARGVYQFFRAAQDPVAQADYLVSQTGPLGAGDLPPFCDMETLDGVSASQATTNMAAWLAEIKLRTGLTAAIYSSKSFWATLNNPTGFSMNDLWVANWGVTSPALPPIWRDWNFWQYSSSGTVPGVNGSPGVDVSVFNGTTTDVQAYAGMPVPSGFYRGLAVDSTGQGFWTCAYDGGVFAYGDATFRGSGGGTVYPQPILGITRTPTGFGYWLFGADGNVLTFGDAVAAGNLAGTTLGSPIVALAATPSGKGYWLVAEDGTVTPEGDAVSYGQPSPAGLSVVGAAATPSGKGYWLAAADGRIFAFGDAVSLGDMSGKLSQPAVALAATPSGKGYWLVESDGGVQAFGDASPLTYQGSLARNAPVVGIASSLTGQGYWLVATDGTIFPVGDAVDAGERAR